MKSSPTNHHIHDTSVRLGEITHRAFALPGMPTTGCIHLMDVAEKLKKYYRAEVTYARLRHAVIAGKVPATCIGMAWVMRWEDVPAMARHLGILVTPDTQ